MTVNNNLVIDFDFSYYLGPSAAPQQTTNTSINPDLQLDLDTGLPLNNVPAQTTTTSWTSGPKIIELTSDQIKCQRIVVSVMARNLEPGRQYIINYQLTNSANDIFTPASETFYASRPEQKFSTVAVINDQDIYIMKVVITKLGSNVSASDMVTVKCGTIVNCPTDPIPVVLSEYIKFDNKPIYTIAPPYRCDSQININAQIYNAVLGEQYTYTFSSLETNPKNTITFMPSSGVVVAGDTTQNLNCTAKFIGKSRLFCIKILAENSSGRQLEDYLLIECGQC
jgi:hypothetical protein